MAWQQAGRWRVCGSVHQQGVDKKGWRQWRLGDNVTAQKELARGSDLVEVIAHIAQMEGAV
ncbi:hypothetical protein BDN70DRAFT_939994 [Pholiota conissans]|uniref:Uncharacterized protein n=1 Tax=Pholiota conissans TaxID=109636 RepID=A0A9P6CQF2_9AGAR|nr:hypothetical protein BDN70DRAFT_939994 [Pholiota conissans]